jgi:hypothetical protein
MTEQVATETTATATPEAAPPPAAPAEATPPVAGDPAAPPPAEAAPPPAEPEKPKLGEELSTIAKVARAKLMETRRLRAERNQIKAERGQVQQKSTEAEAAIKQNAEFKATLDRLKSSPAEAIEFLKQNGVKPEHVLDAAVKAGTPEALADEQRRANESALAEIRAENAALKAKIDEIVNGSRQTEEQRAQAQQAQLRQQAEHQFLAMIQTKADRYEALTNLYSPEEVKAQAYAVVQEATARAKQKGIPLPELDDEEIADYLEQRAKPRYDAVVKRAMERRGNGPVTTGQGTAEAPRTLTNTMSTERSAQRLDPSTLSPDEQIRYWAAEYDRLAGKGAPKP